MPSIFFTFCIFFPVLGNSIIDIACYLKPKAERDAFLLLAIFTY
jgi:hypothetical protein